jgi:hypothetical protein
MLFLWRVEARERAVSRWMGEVPGEAPQKTQITALGEALFGSEEDAIVDAGSESKLLV